MKIAIMQPYIFPYLGYFQLFDAVDAFVFYDDVNFIKQGWINRNKINASGKESFFNIPVVKASSFKAIDQTYVHPREYKFWKKKFTKNLIQNYRKAPHFESAISLIDEILNEEEVTIADLSKKSIIHILNFLDLRKVIYNSSSKFHNSELKGEFRVLDICKQLNADTYINMPGGRNLYDLKKFQRHGIQLLFLEPYFPNYEQIGGNKFLPGLSIIDLLMNCSKLEIQGMMKGYKIK